MAINFLNAPLDHDQINFVVRNVCAGLVAETKMTLIKVLDHTVDDQVLADLDLSDC